MTHNGFRWGRIGMEPQEEHDRQQLRIAELLYERKYHRVCGLRVLTSDINGKRKQREPVKHLGPFFLTGRNASSHTVMSARQPMLPVRIKLR